jgi:hypothetical protein
LREKKVIAGQKHLANIRIKKINGDGESVTCRIIGATGKHTAAPSNGCKPTAATGQR